MHQQQQHQQQHQQQQYQEQQHQEQRIQYDIGCSGIGSCPMDHSFHYRSPSRFTLGSLSSTSVASAASSSCSSTTNSSSVASTVVSSNHASLAHLSKPSAFTPFPKLAPLSPFIVPPAPITNPFILATTTNQQTPIFHTSTCASISDNKSSVLPDITLPYNYSYVHLGADLATSSAITAVNTQNSVAPVGLSDLSSSLSPPLRNISSATSGQSFSYPPTRLIPSPTAQQAILHRSRTGEYPQQPLQSPVASILSPNLQQQQQPPFLSLRICDLLGIPLRKKHERTPSPAEEHHFCKTLFATGSCTTNCAAAHHLKDVFVHHLAISYKKSPCPAYIAQGAAEPQSKNDFFYGNCPDVAKSGGKFCLKTHGEPTFVSTSYRAGRILFGWHDFAVDINTINEVANGRQFSEYVDALHWTQTHHQLPPLYESYRRFPTATEQQAAKFLIEQFTVFTTPRATLPTWCTSTINRRTGSDREKARQFEIQCVEDTNKVLRFFAENLTRFCSSELLTASGLSIRDGHKHLFKTV
ncbi:hypothetical protein GQ42DRAFT_180712 [Ramicandelaber brevisporus]|nr:hypothetical protein GQ42DRAFT_180712 [Ramicandelaber brevisporus]